MKVILIDDEPDALQSLSTLILENCSDVNIVDTCSRTAQAEASIQKHHPDLIFLDIKMPEENGLSFIERVGHKEFEVVFATAYGEYALHAFQLSALDYITKPFTATQVSVAVNRAAERIGQKRAAERFTVMQEILLGKPRRMIVNTGKMEELVYFDQLACLKADGHCTHFYLVNGRRLVTSSNLGEYVEALIPHGFLRAHNSWVVNNMHILRYNPGDNALEMSNGEKVPIGRVYKEEVLKHLRG